jgi:hypothetical protein
LEGMIATDSLHIQLAPDAEFLWGLFADGFTL